MFKNGKNNLNFLVFFIFIILSNIVSSSPKHELSRVMIPVSNRTDVDVLTRMLFIEIVGIRPSYILADVTSEEMQILKKQGFSFEVVLDDVYDVRSKDYIRDIDNPALDYSYHTYTTLMDAYQGLAASYPGLTMLDTLGYSVEGRLMLAIKISDNADTDENEAEVRFDTTIHGDEKMGVELCYLLAEYLLSNYGSNPTIKNLVNNREIWIIALNNPDGHVRNSRYNSHTVDLNRDFGYMWDGWGGSPSPFSQPEVIAMRNLYVGNQFVFGSSFHGGTETIAYPWSFHWDSTPDDALFQYFASLYSSTSGYSYGQGSHTMYYINGSSKDTDYGVSGTIGWTHEVSYDFTPPASQIQTYWDKNRQAMLNMIEEAGYGVQGVVTDVNSGNPVPALVRVPGKWVSYCDPVIGDYHKFLKAGTYSLEVWASGYDKKTITGITVSSKNATLKNVELTPSASPLGYLWKAVLCTDPNYNNNNHTLTVNALGPHDATWYSIGVGDYIVFDLLEPVVNLPGNDIHVYEGNDGTSETVKVYISNNWADSWVYVGQGTGNFSLDISSTGMQSARYIKFVDDGNGSQSEPNPGYDLDACEVSIQTIAPSLEVTAVPDSTSLKRGDVLGVDVTIKNLGSTPASFDAWVDIILPNGKPYPGNPLVGPLTGTLRGNGQVIKKFSHKIPSSAPLGVFTYEVKAGDFPSEIWAQDSFTFEVIE